MFVVGIRSHVYFHLFGPNFIISAAQSIDYIKKKMLENTESMFLQGKESKKKKKPRFELEE